MTFSPPSEFAGLSAALRADARLIRQPKSIRAAESMAPGPFIGGEMPRPLAGRALRRLASCEPARDTGNRLAHFVGRARVGKTNEPMAVHRIEIDAGGGRDMGLFQHLLGEFETVRREGGDVGVEVKCAVGGQ